jgi:hypothetical protein
MDVMMRLRRLGSLSLPPSLALPQRARGVDALMRLRGPARMLEKNKIKINYYNYFFGCYCLLEKRGKKMFGFQSSRSPSSPSSAGFAGEAARRRRFFWPSSPSHPSKLYSSLGWLNFKVPKPFFPFTLRLIDVDGF